MKKIIMFPLVLVTSIIIFLFSYSSCSLIQDEIETTISDNTYTQIETEGSTTIIVEKKTEDVAILKEIIEAQKREGAIVDENLDNKSQYKWDENTGALVGVVWNYKKLSGKLDLSYLSELQSVSVYGNELSELNVSYLKRLVEVNCNDNKIEIVNVSGCDKLMELYCGGNEIKDITLDDLTNLENLYCPYNQLYALDLSNLTEVYLLDCSNNKLEKLLLNNNSFFEEGGIINCAYNELTEIELFSIGVEYLECNNNKLQNINIVGLKDLRKLNCTNNNISQLNCKGLKKLKSVKCDEDVEVIGFEK